MRRRNGLSILSLIASAIFLLISFKPSLTGGFIGINLDISPLYLISSVFFLVSILIFATRQTLDAIMIPTGTREADKERTDKAVEEYYLGRGADFLLISGRIDRPIETSQVYDIYKRLKGYGIKQEEVQVEGRSANTLENVLFSLEKLKKRGAKDVGIASNPMHLDRFEYIIEKAKESGIIDRDFRVHRLETSEDLKQKWYELLAGLKYRYKLREGIPAEYKPKKLSV
jgi:uncharacterized SAM-binding protein YcdF (DUF218 family)